MNAKDHLQIFIRPIKIQNLSIAIKVNVTSLKLLQIVYAKEFL